MLMPSMERVRFVSSGTEAAMSALRVARAATRREQDHQVRRLLSRSRRLVPRPGGIGRDDAGRADEPGRARGRGGGHDSRALQRSRLGRTGVCQAHRADCRHVRRADCGQHGPRGAARRLSAGPSSPLRSRGRAARIRRGDLRLQSVSRRSAESIRREAGSHVPRQDHRRRAAGWRVRRARGHHGAGGA